MQFKDSNQTNAAAKILPLRERATFFTRADNDLFQYLITKYKDILFENKTDNYTKRLKQCAWLAILDEFNMAAEEPRTLRKLKFKFHNTKTKARKSIVSTNVGKKPFITNSNDIKWMQSILAVSNPTNVVGAEEYYNDHNQDAELDRAQIEIVQYKPLETKDDVIEVPVSPASYNNVASVKNIEMDVEIDVKETIVPEQELLSISRRPFSEVTVKSVTKKAEIIKDPVNRSVSTDAEHFNVPAKVATGNQILDALKPKKLTNYDKKLYKLHARHMQEQRNEEHELFQLKKKKIQLEINLLVKSK